MLSDGTWGAGANYGLRPNGSDKGIADMRNAEKLNEAMFQAHKAEKQAEGSNSLLIDGLDAHRIGKEELRAVKELAYSVQNSKIKLPIRMRDYARSVIKMIDTRRI